MSPGVIIAVFVGVLLGLAVVAGIVVLLSTPPPPISNCQPGQPCADPPGTPPQVADASPVASPTPATPATAAPPATGAPPATAAPSPLPSAAPTGDPTSAPTGQPTAAPATPAPTQTPGSDSPEAVSGTVWSDEELAYSFEFDESVFRLGTSEPGLAVLNGIFFDTQVVIRATQAATSPGQLIAEQIGRVDRFLIGRVADQDPYDAVLGPSIGYVRGEGGVFAGTIVNQDGTPVAPGGVTILAATDGRITVAVLVIVGTPDVLLGEDTTHQKAVRSAADEILKSFEWDSR
jgi:hypothetical protein